ncbi:MAG: hypothetical protein ACRBN8_23285 [Nannocystales bacterium]
MSQLRELKVLWVLALGLVAGCRGGSSAEPNDNTSSTGSTSSASVAGSSEGGGSSVTSSSGSDSSSSGESSDASSSSGEACVAVLEPLPPELLPRCTNETLVCAAGCGEEDIDCIDACLQEDTTPPEPITGVDCSSCSIVQLLACSDPACHDENAAFMCCNAACEGQDCAEDACEAELSAAFECAVFSAAPCLEANAAGTDGCFPAEDDAAR